MEEVQNTDTLVSTFATADALRIYHSVESLEEDVRALADGHPEIAQLHEIGRSVENRPIWALQIGERQGSDRKLLLLGCHHV
ncbi:MAG: M14 family zinc carboxypeptidase [Gammaproteobacteria bacterium]